MINTETTKKQIEMLKRTVKKLEYNQLARKMLDILNTYNSQLADIQKQIDDIYKNLNSKE